MTTFLNLHIVIFENFIKSMKSCLSKLKVAPSFCFTFIIPDYPTASTKYIPIFPLVFKNLLPQIATKRHFVFLVYWIKYVLSLDRHGLNSRPLFSFFFQFKVFQHFKELIRLALTDLQKLQDIAHAKC